MYTSWREYFDLNGKQGRAEPEVDSRDKTPKPSKTTYGPYLPKPLHRILAHIARPPRRHPPPIRRAQPGHANGPPPPDQPRRPTSSRTAASTPPRPSSCPTVSLVLSVRGVVGGRRWEAGCGPFFGLWRCGNWIVCFCGSVQGGLEPVEILGAEVVLPCHIRVGVAGLIRGWLFWRGPILVFAGRRCTVPGAEVVLPCSIGVGDGSFIGGWLS